MRFLSALIVLALSVTSADVIAARPGQGAATASVSGTASDAAGHALTNSSVQLRNVSTGQLAGRATTNGLGQFSFGSLPPGTYVVEVANATGQIVGTSGSVIVGAGASVTGVGVTSATATSAATAAAGGLGSHHIALILGAAAAAGVAGGVAMAVGGTASPSQ